MGLIKAGLGAAGGTLADQWKEFFYCDALDKDVLVKRGQKRISGRSSNTKGNDNVISDGSGIAVANGQSMIIVEQGKIVEFCAEPGEYTYNNSLEPTVFSGDLGESVKETFKTMARRFTFGGDTARDQRVYYFNTKEIMDNKFGTPNPLMFDVVNKELGMRRTVQVRCNGVYSYKITNPILFYTEVCGNVQQEFTREEIDRQLKTEFIDALQPAFASLSELELRPAQIPAHAGELKNAMNDALQRDWSERRGITVQSIAMNPITLTAEDFKKINQMEDAATLGGNAFMMAGRMADSTATAMENAAGNPNGAMMGFMGMNMAQQAGGGANIQNLYAMGQQQREMQQGKQQQAAVEGWTCSSCGTVNKGKFCMECGAKKPAAAPLYRCDKCGWEPEDPKNPPKFCPECGDSFDEGDIR
jgi:membrane protease subunit (stomatin/prohibitin family)